MHSKLHATHCVTHQLLHLVIADVCIVVGSTRLLNNNKKNTVNLTRKTTTITSSCIYFFHFLHLNTFFLCMALPAPATTLQIHLHGEVFEEGAAICNKLKATKQTHYGIGVGQKTGQHKGIPFRACIELQNEVTSRMKYVAFT